MRRPEVGSHDIADFLPQADTGFTKLRRIQPVKSIPHPKNPAEVAYNSAAADMTQFFQEIVKRPQKLGEEMGSPEDFENDLNTLKIKARNAGKTFGLGLFVDDIAKIREPLLSRYRQNDANSLIHQLEERIRREASF